METNKILTANILDLLFDNRNKDYGAYELRKTYQQRIVRSLLTTLTITGLIYAGAALAMSSKSQHTDRYVVKTVEIQPIDQKPPEKIPETPKPRPTVKTEIFTPPIIVDKEKIENPPPTVEDLDSAKIGLKKNEGINYTGVTEPSVLDDGKGVVDTKPENNNEPFRSVEVDAKFKGNWIQFLEMTLNPNVAVDNGAPMGTYKVIIQFVVDLDGNLSDIKALTNYGYGLEQEAIRAIKKAKGWEPAFQNGRHVKAYRIQPITFIVPEE